MKNILMNVEMTKAVLDGCKVQTRRVIKTPFEAPSKEYYASPYNNGSKWFWWTKDHRQNLNQVAVSKYQIGETIWVREPAKVILSDNERMIMRYKYLADDFHITMNIPERFENSNWVWDCQGIPNGCIKEMARIFLKITNVRVEKMKEISYSDLINEGFVCDWNLPKRERENELYKQYMKYFENTPIDASVFVYEFERVEQ